MKRIEVELANAIEILDGFYAAEGGKTKNARVFDDAIRGLRYIQEYGYPATYGEAYERRRNEKACDYRTIPVIAERM